jgi:hypothetical protein
MLAILIASMLSACASETPLQRHNREFEEFARSCGAHICHLKPFVWDDRR